MAVKAGMRETRRDEYIGETKNHLRDGYGVYNYANKFFRYEGEWMNGRKHGHGKLVMKDGSYYEGEFQNGEIEGHGFKYFATSSNSYTGQFHEGELQGSGIMRYKDGGYYEGEWHKSKRNGHGIYKMPNSSTYQGNFYLHKRHGEGTQVYENGDRYDGDWVQDKRQGHGELRCRDGTIYEGSWRNDLYNGEGTMIHCSGFIYEGMWLNGKPENMGSKLVILGDTTLELTQGQTFTIEVECQNEEGQKVEDDGRELSIIAGFKHMVPKEGTALFDVIEDVEETPVSTPFGFDIVSFPLTDQMPEEPKSDTEGTAPSTGMKSVTSLSLSEQTIQEDKAAESKDEELFEASEPKDAEKLAEPSAEPANESTSRPESPTAKTSSEEPTLTSDQDNRESTPLPPPAFNTRTDKGLAEWTDLVLPAAPPMYRPYAILDDETGSTQLSVKKSRSVASKSKDAKNKSPPDDERSVSRYKRLGDERFARPGEYVIMVQDATSPPFMNYTLEPAFLLVKLTVPKKTRAKKEKGPTKNAPPPKQQGPEWDTSQHIADSMANGVREGVIREATEYEEKMASLENSVEEPDHKS